MHSMHFLKMQDKVDNINKKGKEIYDKYHSIEYYEYVNTE